MYNVLLVDDERIILDGITDVIDWATVGTTLAGTARNGIEAFEFVRRSPPDIVISDIKMPGMDGLELAGQIHKHYPRIKLILLSGFGEFEYAQLAIQYGVKHYLLKPCNELKIVEALRKLVDELDREKQREQFVRQMRYGMERVLPHVKEQFLKEFVTNKTYGSRDWEYYRKLFGLDLQGRKVRLVLFQLEGDFEFEHMFAVKNIVEDLLRNMVLSSTVGARVLVVVENTDPVDELYARIGQIRETFLQYYKIDLTIALSEADEITQARSLYKQTLECLDHRFYLGEGSLITKRDIVGAEQPEPGELIFNEDNLMLKIKAGHWDEASAEIDLFFQKLAVLQANIPTFKSYVIQLFMAVIRLGGDDAMLQYRDNLVRLFDLETMQAIRSFFKETAWRITSRHYEQTRNSYRTITDRMLTIVHEQLGNSELSLQWVASQILYMNADYLGKLFKKRTGEKFSNYVMKARISKAMKLMDRKSDIKIFELAEMLGFGDNPQYFSQVFKKYAGRSPSEYIRANDITDF